MKIFLCGQKSFGVAVCKALEDAGHEIVGVAVPPQERLKDKLCGYALLKEYSVIVDAERLVSADIPDGTDLIVAAHSHHLISDRCLDKAKYGGIGFHPSLLPRHRGRDAVRWAVHMGDFASGGSVYRLSGKTDGGDIAAQEVVWIRPGMSYHELWAEIFPVGVRMLVQVCGEIERGTAEWKRQDEDCATWEPSWDRPRLRRNELVMLGGHDSGKDRQTKN